MSKTNTTSTPSNPFVLDPARLLEAQRRGWVSGIEGLLSMQSEMRTAFEAGLGRIRAESETWARMSNEIAGEQLATSFDLAARALTTWKDEVDSFGRANA